MRKRVLREGGYQLIKVVPATAPQAAHTMTTIDSLANETLIEIFTNLDRRSLDQAALVCRRWRDPAQLALFFVVRIRRIRGHDQANRWLASPARGRFRIREARLVGIEAVGPVLEACGGIRSLVLETMRMRMSSDLLLLPSLAG